jgi:hypothetical protein
MCANEVVPGVRESAGLIKICSPDLYQSAAAWLYSGVMRPHAARPVANLTLPAHRHLAPHVVEEVQQERHAALRLLAVGASHFEIECVDLGLDTPQFGQRQLQQPPIHGMQVRARAQARSAPRAWRAAADSRDYSGEKGWGPVDTAEGREIRARNRENTLSMIIL